MEQTKITSAGHLLQQVQSRFKINHSNWRADALDAIGNIINDIGYHTGYQPKTIWLDVKNFKCRLPSEVVSFELVKYKGYPLTRYIGRNSITDRKSNEPILRDASPEDILALQKESDRLTLLKEMYLATPSADLLEDIQNSQRKVTLLVNSVTFHRKKDGYEWYLPEMGFLSFSFESGRVSIDADVFMVDDKGWPMVIDTFKYREACIWGILYYMSLQGYVHPVLSFAKIEDEKEKFVMQAQNEPKMLDIDRHQDFAENWSRVNRGLELDTLNFI